jgi:flagellar hook-basal body complex protein FliE
MNESRMSVTLPLGPRVEGEAASRATPAGRAPAGGATAGGATDFARALGDAVASVDGLQRGADAEAATLATGGGNLHETALALEKADIGMRLMTKVRNRIIEAYQDVMRMSV